MYKGRPLLFISLLSALAAFVMFPAQAHESGHSLELKADLEGFGEVPTLSSPATGKFRAHLNREQTEIRYELSYSGFTTPVLVSHLHLGRRAVNGGVAIFLCSSNTTGPAGTPACPAMEGSVSGILMPVSVVGPAAQGIAPGEWEELVEAIKADAVYANVHSQAFPAGEIRDQVDVKNHHH